MAGVRVTGSRVRNEGKVRNGLGPMVLDGSVMRVAAGVCGDALEASFNAVWSTRMI
jgi:hypothetical protein